MTNKDKFLKDGVSVEEFFGEFNDFCFDNRAKRGTTSYMEDIKDFLNAPVKPTLTEDERVILRNIFGVNFIGRTTDGHLYCSFGKRVDYTNTKLPYDHLFQFIKERRRIRDRGVVK